MPGEHENGHAPDSNRPHAREIFDHSTAASSPTAGLYHNLIRSDGALLQLSNNPVPEPSTAALLSAGAMLLLRRRASRRQG